MNGRHERVSHLAPGLIEPIEPHIGKPLGHGTAAPAIDKALLELLTEAHEKALG